MVRRSDDETRTALHWYLHRALQYVDAGDWRGAVRSLAADVQTNHVIPPNAVGYFAELMLQLSDAFRRGRGAVEAMARDAGLPPLPGPGQPYISERELPADSPATGDPGCPLCGTPHAVTAPHR